MHEKPTIVERTSANRTAEALCFSCRNCSPLRCEWVNSLEWVWSKAIEIRHQLKVDAPVDIKFRVIECDHYIGIETTGEEVE